MSTSMHPRGTSEQHAAPAPAQVKAGCIDPLHEKRYRNFRSSYRAFWTRLVAEMHSLELVLDDIFVDRTTALLISLSWWGRIITMAVHTGNPLSWEYYNRPCFLLLS